MIQSGPTPPITNHPPQTPGRLSIARQRSRIAIATLVGTTVEWYDFNIYALAAVLVFPELFFPDHSKAVAILLSFVTLAVGSLGRPLGAIIFGHIGDRKGRKVALIGSLMLMGIATVMIGLLPTYSQVGLLAPALLLVIRVIQSLAVGGEWGGAVLFAVESAPKNRKALFGAFPQMGDGFGWFLATGVFWLVTLGNQEFFMSWGWRIPFIASAVLVGLGVWIRRQLDESPDFEAARAMQAEAEKSEEKIPLIELMRTAWQPVLVATGGFLITISGYYIVVTYLSARAESVYGLSDSVITAAGNISSIVIIVTIFFTALAADKFGLRVVTLVGIGLHVVVAYPMFILAEKATPTSFTLALSLGMFVSAVAYAPIGTLVTRWFATRVRYTGLSLSYQAAGALGGGLTPVVTQALDIKYESWVPVCILFVVISVLSFACVAFFTGQQYETSGHHDDA